jgi:hypothetical protein
MFTLQVLGAHSDKMINEIEVGSNRGKILSTIEQSYCKAPFYKEVFPVLECILLCEERNLARFVGESIQSLADHMEMTTRFLYLSELQGETALRGQERTIDICKRVGAGLYVNSIGGKKLYSAREFRAEGISLKFLKPEEISYRQFNNEFVPNLSIIDVLMFNSKKAVKSMLGKFTLE